MIVSPPGNIIIDNAQIMPINTIKYHHNKSLFPSHTDRYSVTLPYYAYQFDIRAHFSENSSTYASTGAMLNEGEL